MAINVNENGTLKDLTASGGGGNTISGFDILYKGNYVKDTDITLDRSIYEYMLLWVVNGQNSTNGYSDLASISIPITDTTSKTFASGGSGYDITAYITVNASNNHIIKLGSMPCEYSYVVLIGVR